MKSVTLDQEAILGERDFLRRLARSLVSDPIQAEDLAQQTLLVALSRRPSSFRALRGWLAQVARSIATNQFHAESARVHRELERARTEPPPSPTPDQRLIERELRRDLSVAVRELEPKYREALLPRFYRDLDAPAIASELGIPVDTVRTRQRRAMRKLKDRLERRHGHQNCWIGLSLLATESRRPSPVWPVVAAATLSAAGVWWALDPGHATGPALALAAPELAPAESPPLAAPSGGDRRPTPAAPGPLGSVVPSGAVERDVELWLAFEDSGAPASGLLVALERQDELGWQDKLLFRAQADGRVPLGRLEPGSWRVSPDHGLPVTLELGPGDSRRIEVPRGRPLTGSVAHADGSPAAGAMIWVSLSSGRSQFSAVQATAGPDGRFRLDDVDPTSAIGASLAGHEDSGMFAVDAWSAGEPVALTIGPAADGFGGRVRSGGRPLEGARVTLIPELRRGRSLERERAPLRPPPQHTDSAGGFGFDHLSRFTGRLIATHPSRAPLVLDLVDQRGPLELELEPGLAIQGRVTLPGGGSAAGALVLADFGSVLPAIRTRTAPDGGFALAGLPALACELRAFATVDGGALAAAERRAPGEAEAWNPSLTPGGRIEVRAFTAAGAPAEGYTVVLREDRFRSRLAVLDATGTHRFELCPDRPHLLLLKRPDESFAHLLDGVTPPAHGARPFELRDSSGGRVVGRLRTADPAAMADCRVALKSLHPSFPIETALDPRSGEFSFDGLFAGPFELRLWRGELGPETVTALTLAANQTLRLDPIEVPATGSVVALLEQPYPASVALHGAGDATPLAVARPERGEARFEAVPPGAYELRIGGRDEPLTATPIEVAAYRRTEAWIERTAGIEVELEIHAPADGEALRMVILDGQRSLLELVRPHRSTDPSTGRAGGPWRPTLHLPRGSYTVVLTAGQGAAERFHVSVGAPGPLAPIHLAP